MNTAEWHPLDIDLLALIKDDLDSKGQLQLEKHVFECLLCRIRTRRLASAAGVQLSGAPSDSSISVSVPLSEEFLTSLETKTENPAPASGQLWLAGVDEQLLLWIRKVNESSLICHPVTLDVEIADDETLLVDVDESPLGIPLAVWSAIIGDVHVRNLARFLGVLDLRADIDALHAGDRAAGPDRGPAVGTPIADPTDERIEYRQLLADHLADLSAAVDEFGVEEPEELSSAGVLADLNRRLSDDLLFLGRNCRVSMIHDPALLNLANEIDWSVVGLVSELTCTVLILGCFDEPDRKVRETSTSLQDLIQIGDATALAVTAVYEIDRTYLYDPEHLAQQAIERPSGDWVGPVPRYGPMGLVDAVFKYLEEEARPLGTEFSSDSTLAAMNLDDIITAKARSMIDLKRKARTPIVLKKLAQLTLMERDAELLARVIKSAARGASIVEELRDLADPHD